MKKNTIILIIVLGLLWASVQGFAEDKQKRQLPGVFELDPFLMDVLPGTEFYPFFFENYAPDTTVLIEENNGFSMIDNPRVYFEGDSFVNFNWQYNGFNLNSSLNDGSPGVLLPSSAVTSYRLQGESPLFTNYGMNFVSAAPSCNITQVRASTVYTNMGGYGAIGKFMIQPDHPSSRADELYTPRRKIMDNYYVDILWARQMGTSQVMFAANVFDIKRRFNDFNTFDDVFEEDGKLLLLNGRYRKTISDGHIELFGIYNKRERNALGAETAALPQETATQNANAFMAGLHIEKKLLDLKLSVMLENDTLSPSQNNFSKELLDREGDGFFPFNQKLGKFKATTLNGNLKIPFPFPIFKGKARAHIFADARYAQLKGDETPHNHNPILFDDTAYLVYKGEGGGAYTNVNADVNAGIHLVADISKDIALLAKGFVTLNHLTFDYDANNLSQVTPGFDVGVLLFKNKKTNILFAYGQIPYDIRENVNTFLETARPGGTYFHWNDADGSGTFQAGEEGNIYGFSGGPYHFLAKDADAPIKERLLLHFTTPISRNFRLNIKGLYKKIKNNFRVKFNDEYGFFETHDQHNIHFYDRPFKDYYLTNNYLEKDPFYASFDFNITGKRENKWFFSFSFMAHMGMGDTAFGNGPGSNDIGILAESQADPNSWINGYGRVDGDRGFVAKSYFGFYLFKKCFVAFSLKYRDGNPFAFINRVSAHDQHVLYYSTIQAEDSRGNKGGPREDYLADVSVKLNYGFKLLNKDAQISLTFFNLLDFGAELSEYVFSGGTRDSLELQIPRSMRFTFQWRF